MRLAVISKDGSECGTDELTDTGLQILLGLIEQLRTDAEEALAKELAEAPE